MNDSIINLHKGVPIINKRGNKNYQEEKVENRFRLVVVKNKEQSEKYFWFITNDFELSPKEVANYYRKRWDLEVFF
ncbi:transposase [Flavobacterium sp. LS1P3]|uniref:transposase n=1 Tax=Flavobacterium sp. LS1P3 TaxID=3401720 RepID=UPI003AAFCB63